MSMTSPTRRPFRPSKTAVALVGFGVLLIVVYLALVWAGVGNFGEPTDIGGGALLLAGFACSGIGSVIGIIQFIRR